MPQDTRHWMVLSVHPLTVQLWVYILPAFFNIFSFHPLPPFFNSAMSIGTANAPLGFFRFATCIHTLIMKILSLALSQSRIWCCSQSMAFQIQVLFQYFLPSFCYEWTAWNQHNSEGSTSMTSPVAFTLALSFSAALICLCGVLLHKFYTC